jgi:hypothetical protein
MAHNDFPKRKQAQAHCRTMLRRLREADSAQKGRRADHLARLYLTSLDAKYLATLQANKALPMSRRKHAAELPAIAKSLNPWAGSEERVKLIPKFKDDGNVRLLMSFGIEHRALQYLVLPILRARADVHPAQYASVGVHSAVRRAAELLAEGHTWAIESDIQNCFQSFDGEQAKENLPLPKRVVERVALSSSLLLTLGHDSIFGPAQSDRDDELLIKSLFADARRGIPQGSAISPLIAECLLAPAYHQLSGAGQVVGYADNTLIMGTTKGGVSSTYQSLWAAFMAGSAGQLRPNKPKQFKPGDPIEFLGHRLRLVKGAVWIEPNPVNLKAFESNVGRALSDIRRSDTRAERARRAENLRRYVRSWTAAFSLWPKAKKRREEALKHIAAASAHS